MDESTWHNWNVCCCLVFVVVVGLLLLFCWFFYWFFFGKRWNKIWKPSVSMTDKNPKRKKPVFSCTAPCIMLKFCSHKFSDLQPVDHNRLRAAGFTTDAMPASSLPAVCSRLTLFRDKNIIGLIILLFFSFLFSSSLSLSCSENPQLDVFVQKDVLKQFVFVFVFSISLRWRQLGASWATITTILKGCGTVQGTLAVYRQLKQWSYCYSHPQGMWDSSGHSSSL